MSTAPPPAHSRPRFAHWIWARGLRLREVGTKIGCSGEYVRRICLPFEHPDWRPPNPKVLAAIVDWTAGEFSAADFYPPHLNGRREDSARAFA